MQGGLAIFDRACHLGLSESDNSHQPMNDRPLHFELPTFGRRRGRKLSKSQSGLLNELISSPQIDLSAPPPSKLDILFSSSISRIWLEIGFGGGEHLLAQAHANPDVGIIGAEPFLDGVVKVLTATSRDGRGNVIVHPGDVRPLLRWLPDGCIERLFILFPDPWPKKRHAKRRLVTPANLELIARTMVQGGELRIATDIGDYARTVLFAIQASCKFTWQAHSAADWRLRPMDWAGTRYEQKAMQEGRRAYYLRFLRN